MMRHGRILGSVVMVLISVMGMPDTAGASGFADHFAWDTVPSPQTSGIPFVVRITAQDAVNNTVALFSNVVTLGTLGGNGPARVILNADFESGYDGFSISNSIGFGRGLWHRSIGRGLLNGHSASNSFYYGTGETLAGEGTYANGYANEGVMDSPILDLQGIQTPVTLTFSYVLRTENNPNYDHASVELSTNGSVFFVLASNNQGGRKLSETSSWSTVSLDLSAYTNTQIKIRFHFNTQDSINNAFEGWYVDDVMLTCGTESLVGLVPTNTGAFVGGVWLGALRITNAASDIRLYALDEEGRAGTSMPFRVVSGEGADPMVLFLPASGYEGQTVTNGGLVIVEAPPATNVVITLFSSAPSELRVPNQVTVPAGALSAAFDVCFQTDAATDGAQSVRVSAIAPSIGSATGSVVVLDRDVHHFVWRAIASPQYSGAPFAAGVSAADVNGSTITVCQGSVALTGAGDGGAVVISPASVPLVNGVWTGCVSVGTADTNIRLTVHDGDGNSGESEAFVVLNEVIEKPGLVGAGDTYKNTILIFSASATNNSGHEMQYLFDWGDGLNSGWTTWVAAHTWTNTGLFMVNVRARCATDTNLVSACSDPFWVMVRAMRLSGEVAFGHVVVDTAAQCKLNIFNDGSNALDVISILTSDPAFTVEPQQVAVPPGCSSNVTVTFLPSAPGIYSATLTVRAAEVAETMVSGTGVVAEAVHVVTLHGPEYGFTGETISFTAQATNNHALYGHGVQYRFNWGDGRTSTWSSVSSCATNWSVVGVNTISVQARCVIDTNVVSAWYVLPVTLTVRTAPMVEWPASNTNGLPIPVSVTVNDVTACTLYYAPAGSSFFQALPLTLRGGSWIGMIPPINAGYMRYYIQYAIAGLEIVTWPSAEPYPDYLISALPGERRYTDFGGWMRDTLAPGGGDSTNFFRPVAGGGQWLASGVLVGETVGTKPDGSVAPWLFLCSIKNAFFRSPVLDDGGVGTIYYTACMKNAAHAARVLVQVSSCSTPDEWHTVASISFPAGDPGLQRATPILVNRRDVRHVRFVRDDMGDDDTSTLRLDGAVVFDNIAISYPPSDVLISERLRNPGYPARDQEVKVRCVVTDTDAPFPTVNRRVKCYYTWQRVDPAVPLVPVLPPFASNVTMTAQGNDLYEGAIPRHEPGMLSYYFGCEFDGYYFALDPDGTGGAQTTNSENQIRTMLPAAVTATSSVPSSAFSYEVRRYRSIFAGVAIEADPSAASVATNEVTLVADHTWQGLTLVKGITNLTWRFVGYNAYTNDAVAFDPNPWSMGDDDQDAVKPPISGQIEHPAAIDMRAELEHEGMLLFQINTDMARRDYVVKRGVFQNFDTPFWQASPRIFEESTGSYPIRAFYNNLDSNSETWLADAYQPGDTSSSTFENLTAKVGQDYVPPPGEAASLNWAYAYGKAVAERAYIAAPSANTAVALSALCRGYLWNNSQGFTPGINSFNFNARASLDDRYAATYKGTSGDNPFLWGNGSGAYVVTVTLRASEISPASAYLSTMVFYQPTEGGGGWGSFYEVRLVQVAKPDLAYADNRVRIQVFRWNDGMTGLTEVPCTSGTEVVDGQKLTAGNKSLEITVDAASMPGKTRVQVRHDWTGGFNWNVAPVRFDDSDSLRLTSGGSVGFMTFDAVPVISRLEIRTTNNAVMLPVITDWSDKTNRWFMGGKRSDGLTRWQVSAAGSLVRPLPTVYLGVYTAPDNSEDQPSYNELTPRYQVTVSSLSPANIAVQLREWSKMFILVQNCQTNALKTLNDLPIVVDNPTMTPWRAKSRSMPQLNSPGYLGWGSWGDQYTWANEEKGWAVLEGWVGASAGSSGSEVQFERSRANPALVQGIITPVLSNGIGSIAFNYRTTGSGRSVFAIECTDSSGDQSDYNIDYPKLVVTNDSSVPASLYLPIRTNHMGRIRVRLRAESDPYAVLKIDNLVARDYPPSDATTWRAYNMLITTLQTNRTWEAQSGYLNNSADKGTAGSTNLDSVGTEVLSEFRPFIQSPEVGTGIGEIRFKYRAWDTNGAGRIELKVAQAQNTPEAQWVSLTNFTFAYSQDYEDFVMEPYDLKHKVLRIYGYTNGFNRVCLDNILMTEPVRTGYEIRRVTLSPVQPLENQSVDVEVEIGRFIMNPSNIQVFVSYHTTPTNVWGYTNWWTNASSAGSVKLELTNSPSGSRIYRTTSGARIPAFPVDTPVQFIAWGTHADLPESDPNKIFQQTNTFTNPSWYYPRNLNGPAGGLENGLGAQGWSPYYFVYSCAPGAVWVNEINYLRWISPDDYEFIELVGPAQTLIGGWRIESIDVDNYNHMLDGCSIANETRLPDDKDGWGFFVWGDPNTPNVDQVFDYPVDQNLPESGGVRLVRSMGAWEQRLAYGESRANLFPYGYEDIGYKPFDFDPDVLCLIGSGNSYTNYQWIRLVGAETRTPGAKNTSQVLKPNLPTFFTIWSVIDTNGSHSVSALPVASIQVASGGATQIVYTANQWFQIASFQTNGVSVAAALGKTNYLWSVSNVLGNISNNVTFYRPLWTITQVVGSNGSASPTGTVSVLNGASTSIVYTATNWYRIATLTTNGIAVTGAVGQPTNVLVLSQIVGNISNQVSFALATPQQTGYTNVQTEWLAAWGQSESTPFDHDVYDVNDEYLIDTSPYISNLFHFAVSGLSVTNPNVYVDVKLLVDSAAHQHINGWLKLYSRPSLTSGNWTVESGTAVTGNVFNVNGVKSYVLSGAAITNQFFKAAITP